MVLNILCNEIPGVHLKQGYTHSLFTNDILYVALNRLQYYIEKSPEV
jgi:hypothetical protein